jgi:HlyD family secretion protein
VNGNTKLFPTFAPDLPDKMMKLFISAVITSIVFFSCKRKPDLVHPEKKSITEAVYASGYLVPEDEYKVFSLADGYLNQILVTEGDTVSAGQVMFEVDNKVQSSRNEAAAEALRIASENAGANSSVLMELKAMVESAYNKYRLDSLNYYRYKKLHDQGVGSELDFNKADLVYKNSKNDYLAAVNRLDRTRNQLQVELINARNAYTGASQEEGNTFIKSQIGGMVYDILKKPGEAVRRGEVIAILGSTKDFYLKLSVDETDITRIKPGQKVLVKTDVSGNQVFNAHITKVYPLMNQLEQSFRVDAVFDEGVSTKFSGTSLEANIIIANKDNVLVVPKSCVSGGDSVTVWNDGKKEKVRIKKGLENLDYVEVLDGLNENTALVK